MTYPFVSGETLTAAAMNSIGLYHVKTQTISGTPTSVTITSAFSSDFDHYRIIGYSLDCSTTGDDIEMELGSGGSHTSKYYGSTTSRKFNAGAVFTNYNNQPPMPIAFTSASAGLPNIDVMLYAPQVAGYTTWSQSAGSLRGYDVNGCYFETDQFTSVTFEVTAGTWVGGEFRVYGVTDG
jgi:hypothetical protein